jgi:dipeptide/tripeptide permease
MALSHKARRRWSLVILLIGLPLYIIVAISLTGWFGARYGRLPILAEVAVYIVLGFLWAVPFRFVFRGIGKPDPETETERSGDRSA